MRPPIVGDVIGERGHGYSSSSVAAFCLRTLLYIYIALHTHRGAGDVVIYRATCFVLHTTVHESFFCKIGMIWMVCCGIMFREASVVGQQRYSHWWRLFFAVIHLIGRGSFMFFFLSLSRSEIRHLVSENDLSCDLFRTAHVLLIPGST